MSINKSSESSPECVVEAVDSLQSRKAKPDEQKIISYLIKKYRIKTNDAKLLINEALAEGIVVKVNYADSVSFRTPQKFGQMLRNHQNHIIPFDGNTIPVNAIKRVIIAMSQLLKSVPINQKLGVTIVDLLNQLHNTSQLLNYNESVLERLLRQALKEGYIDRLDSGSYIVSSQCKQLEGTQKLYFKSTDNSKSKMETEKKFVDKEENTIPEGASLLATNQFAARELEPLRKRKYKPSLNSKPVLQRVRPISKRKKFKKSLGPDFLEPAELGMQYLRDTFEPKCDICSLTLFSSSTSLNEDLLHCNNCDAKAHPSCLNLNDQEVAHKTQWQCMNCKICSVCQQSKENEYVIICMTCSKGFHVKCHFTPIINRPKGNWYCKICCSKGTTNSGPNGISKRVLNDFDVLFNDESDDKSDVSTKEGKIVDLISENGPNSDPIDKERDDSDNCSDVTKDDEQTNCVEKPDEELEMETNATDLYSVNIETLNGINSVNENINEDLNDAENETNQLASPESGDLAASGVSLPESPQKWSVGDVESFIRDAGFPIESKVFKDQEIDGRSLMLLRRMDVLTGLSLKLGPALKIYSHIMRLQGRDQFNY